MSFNLIFLKYFASKVILVFILAPQKPQIIKQNPKVNCYQPLYRDKILIIIKTNS